jgi:hypothetical protein
LKQVLPALVDIISLETIADGQQCRGEATNKVKSVSKHSPSDANVHASGEKKCNNINSAVCPDIPTTSFPKFSCGDCVFKKNKYNSQTVHYADIGVIKDISKTDLEDGSSSFKYAICGAVGGKKITWVEECQLMLQINQISRAEQNMIASDDHAATSRVKSEGVVFNDMDTTIQPQTDATTAAVGHSSKKKSTETQKRNHFTRSSNCENEVVIRDFIKEDHQDEFLDGRVFAAISNMEKILISAPILRMHDSSFESMLRDIRKAVSSRNSQNLQEVASSLNDFCMAATMTLFGGSY